jgi:hypothetical protein
LGGFDLQRIDDTIGDMIAMASPFAGYMTVRQVMKEIGARAPSTVTRLIYDEDKPRPDGKRLAGTLIPGHGWMIQRKSVAAFKAEEAARPPGVGFPRGRDRSRQDGTEAEQTSKAAKRAAKSARPARKAKGG